MFLHQWFLLGNSTQNSSALIWVWFGVCDVFPESRSCSERLSDPGWSFWGLGHRSQRSAAVFVHVTVVSLHVSARGFSDSLWFSLICKGVDASGNHGEEQQKLEAVEMTEQTWIPACLSDLMNDMNEQLSQETKCLRCFKKWFPNLLAWRCL